MFSDQAMLRNKAIELESQLEIHRLRNVELAQLLEELQATQAELLNREKLASLGSLVAALAHEINSPLGVIQSSSDLTLRCAEKLGTSEAKAAIEVLRTNARLIADASATNREAGDKSERVSPTWTAQSLARSMLLNR